jgi:hypothetical protein
MKLSLKCTTPGKIIDVEVDENATVLNVKEKVRSMINIPSGKVINLICLGRTLNDDETLKGANITEKSVVVYFISVVCPFLSFYVFIYFSLSDLQTNSNLLYNLIHLPRQKALLLLWKVKRW